MKISKIVLTLIAAGMGAGLVPAAHAADVDRLTQLEQQLKALQQEIQAMKAASAKEIADIRDQATAQVKESVVGGDIPNSFRMPNSETSVRVYGYAEADLIHDIKGTPSADFFTNLPGQPLNKDNAKSGKTVLTGETSRFGFETSTPTSVGPIHTQLEGDFYSYGNAQGSNSVLRLRQAYGEYAGWLIGQTWSTFMDGDNGPETVDFNGPIGMPFARVGQIRYTYAMASGATFKIALEDGSHANVSSAVGASRPTLVLSAAKSADWGNVNLRLLSHEQRTASASKTGSGWGIGGQYKISSDFILMGQYAEVDADNNNPNAMLGANFPVVDANGGIQMDRSRGGVIGLTKVYDEKLRTTLAYGFVESVASDAYVAATGDNTLINKRMNQWHLNFIYTPIKNVDLGAELIGGSRENYAGDKGDLSRLNLMARYSFN